MNGILHLDKEMNPIVPTNTRAADIKKKKANNKKENSQEKVASADNAN